MSMKCIYVLYPRCNSVVTLPYPKHFTFKNLQILITGKWFFKTSFTCCHIGSQEFTLSSVTHKLSPRSLKIETYKTRSPSLYPLRNSFSNNWTSNSRIGLTKGNGSKRHRGIDKRDLERGRIRNPFITELKSVFSNFFFDACSISASVKIISYILTTKSKPLISAKDHAT